VENVDAFMRRIQGMLAKGDNGAMMAKIREVVAKMDYKQIAN
jgi:hypothetical protein